MKDGFFQKPAGAAETSNIFVANCGPAVGISEEEVNDVLLPLGAISVDFHRSSIVCARFLDKTAASNALKVLTSQSTEKRYGRKFVVRFADYVPEEPPKANQEVLTSTTDCGVPGLQLYTEFVSPAEELVLAAVVDGQDWESLANRRVQHYGFRFEYKTRNVDVKKPVQSIPATVQPVVERLQALHEVPKVIDQLTVNEYPSGVGLAPHIDTHSAFSGAIASLSLCGGCIMELRRDGVHKAIYLPPRSLLVMAGPARYEWQHYIPHRKSDNVNGVMVPRAPRRVSFTFRKVRGFPCNCSFPEHCDSQSSTLPQTRLLQMDSQNGDAGEDRCKHEPTAERDPLSGGAQEGEVDRQLCSNAGLEMESKHVHAVYEVIAAHFSSTRFAVWPKVKEFLLSLPQGGVLADVGCGNGKYFAVRRDMVLLGSDRSSGLAAQAARLCRAASALASSDAGEPGSGKSTGVPKSEAKTAACDLNNPHIGCSGTVRAPLADVLVADALHLPYRDACADAVMSIAVLHHISSSARRLQLLGEMLRILKPAGKALVTVWASEQEDTAKLAKWEPIPGDSSGHGEAPEPAAKQGGDYFVPWHVPLHRASAAPALRGMQETAQNPGGTIDPVKGSVMFRRYYHLFNAGELDELICQLPEARLLASFYDKSNWCCVFRKL